MRKMSKPSIFASLLIGDKDGEKEEHVLPMDYIPKIRQGHYIYLRCVDNEQAGWIWFAFVITISQAVH